MQRQEIEHIPIYGKEGQIYVKQKTGSKFVQSNHGCAVHFQVL